MNKNASKVNSVNQTLQNFALFLSHSCRKIRRDLVVSDADGSVGGDIGNLHAQFFLQFRSRAVNSRWGFPTCDEALVVSLAVQQQNFAVAVDGDEVNRAVVINDWREDPVVVFQ